MQPSYVSGPSVIPLIGRTIGQELDRIAAEHGSREAFVSRHQGVRLTYAELDRRADGLALELPDGHSRSTLCLDRQPRSGLAEQRRVGQGGVLESPHE